MKKIIVALILICVFMHGVFAQSTGDLGADVRLIGIFHSNQWRAEVSPDGTVNAGMALHMARVEDLFPTITFEGRRYTVSKMGIEAGQYVLIAGIWPDGTYLFEYWPMAEAYFNERYMGELFVWSHTLGYAIPYSVLLLLLERE
jgi:hypothetical protein